MDTLIIRSQALIDEMLTFVRNTTNSGEADFNCHDDLVMAFLIGVFTLAHTHQSGSLLQQLGRFQEEQLEVLSSQESMEKTIERMKRNDPTKRDMDLASGSLYDTDGMVESGDRSWLNY